MICLNGAAARCVQTGDHVIIMSYCQIEESSVSSHRPKVVFVDGDNRIVKKVHYEKYGVLSEDMIK